MSRIQPTSLALSALLCACSSGGSSAPPDASPATTAPAALVSALPDAAADAPAQTPDAGSDAGEAGDAGDAGSDASAPASYVAFLQKCCAPRAEKHPSLQAACEAGKAEQCALSAEDFKRGCGAPLDRERASALEDKACALGHEPSCNARLAADASEWGDPSTLANMCAKSPLTGCHEMAERIYYLSGPEDANRAIGLYKRACDAGVGKACFRLADRKPELNKAAGTRPPRREEILDLYVRGCRADLELCFGTLANRLHGDWSSPDDRDILPRLLPTLLAGHEKACETDCDCRHAEVARWAASTEPERARKYAEKVCEVWGEANCTPFAEILEKGIGGPADLPRAISLYQAACPADPIACDDLAAMYEEGRGVTANPETARRLAEQACPLIQNFEYPHDNILPQSSVHGGLTPCTRAARYREEGIGGPVNLKGAYQVYYYYCGTKEGVGVCSKRIALGRKLGMP